MEQYQHMNQVRTLLLWLVPISTICLPISLLAQAANVGSSTTYLVSQIASTGSKLFSESDIVAASGLKPGSRISAADLQHASDRLAQTGAFSQISYRFDGVIATFVVVDAEQFVPVTFENFVWFSDADLIKRIHSTVPLFSGSLPLSGNLTESVSGALESILRDHSISGHVIAEANPANGPVSSIQFRIDGLKVAVASINFPGVSPTQLALLQQSTRGLLDHPYMRSETVASIKRQAKAVYGKAGYLKAEVGEAKISLIKDDPSSPIIGLELPIEEGPQFTVAGADWRGNSVISAAELTKAMSCNPGAVADTSCLAFAIAKAQQMYGTKGYMAAQVRATATIDNDAHVATFHLNVEEGPIYHMGKLDLLDLPDEQAQLVRRIWKMQAGDVYDASYVKDFLLKNVKQNPSLSGWEAHYVQTIHDDTRLVDLSMKFQKMQ